MVVKKTQSEIYFERYCDTHGITYNRLQEGASKTPDYELTVDGQRIIVEVKEISLNKEEKESERLLYQRGYSNVHSNTPGDRVRKKISNAPAQIGAQTQGIYPGLLVLFDRGFVAGHLDPYNLRVAMYGLEQIIIAVPDDRSISPYAIGKIYGPKRKMTEEHNTSISSIGVLFAPRANRIELHVYHNKYATVPLNPKLLSKYGILQFELEDEMPSKTAKWQEICSQ